jgi:hypothetical protein
MGDFLIGFSAGFMSCFGVFFVLCYLREIRDVIDNLVYNLKTILRSKGLLK